METTHISSPKVQRALISVSDKQGLVDFARTLIDAGVTLFSTGGTARCLQDAGLAVQEVSAYTGFPEMMDGRLKTLHPKVFGGILCRRDRDDDMTSLSEHGIVPFELVVVNLYPFEATVRRPGVTLDEAIEQIDIGGPSLVRAAAKNHAFVTIATSAQQYAAIAAEIQTAGATSLDLRRKLAGEAFAHTAQYDRAIADYFARRPEDGPFPASLHLPLERQAVLRYGENPHQGAALYRLPNAAGANLVAARQLNGKELSYNNLMDLDAALGLVRSLPDSAAVVIKHTNPCGAASDTSLVEATRRAFAGDPASAFGSVIGLNRPVDEATAEFLATPGLFVEAIVAPSFAPAAVAILTTKPKWKSNVRLMEVGDLAAPPARMHLRHVDGGLLVQDADVHSDEPETWEVVTERAPTDAQWNEMKFAWAVMRHVKSNAIVLCQDRMLCGAGAGQMSRVDSVEIAIDKAGARAAGCVLASDAFFPFADSIHRAAAAGIAAIIQPGGSRKDDEVIAACNEHHLPMVFTHRRHFKH